MATMPWSIPVWNGMTGPTTTVTGQVRLNTTSNALEIYTGSAWTQVINKSPETWQEWFKHHIVQSNDTDRYAQKNYLNREMQARFPGDYQVDLVGNDWGMVFDTPADETWFHLKYA